MLKKVIVGFLAAAISIPASLASVSPAFAETYDPNAPEVIALEQLPTTTPVASDPGNASSPSQCNQPFPASPVVICGYASFSNLAGAQQSSWGQRATSGLPQEIWTNPRTSVPYASGWDDRKSDFWHRTKTAKDPSAEGAIIPTSLTTNINARTIGKDLRYWSKGVFWRDIRTWSVEHRVVRNTRTVTVAEGELVPEQKIEVSLKPKIVITIPAYRKAPTPVTVYQTIVYDNIWGNSGSSSPRTYSSPGTYTYTEYTHYYDPFWISRTVDWGNVSYYPTPEIKQVWCQIELGPGTLEGPYDHDNSSLKSKIGISDADLDPQTILRKWWTKPPQSMSGKIRNGEEGGFILLSNIGLAAESDKNSRNRILVPGNPEAKRLVLNCIEDKPEYLASATNQPCVVQEPTHPLFGQELPATHELCNTFVPGNYLKNLGQSQEILCTYTIRNWIGFDSNNIQGSYSAIQLGRSPNSENERVSFVHCGRPVDAANNPDRPNSPNSIYYSNVKAFWACAGDTPEKGNNTWHPDPTYDFLTCGQTFQCQVPSGDTRPVITDMTSNTSTRSTSQLLASGAQTEVRWETPSGIDVLDRNGRVTGTIEPDLTNAWQSWTVIANSAPWFFDKDRNDPSQPVYGSNLANSNPNSSESILNYGVNSWDSPNLYLRGYKGTTNARNATSVGDVSVAPGDLIPFGVYTEYNSTIQRDTVVFGRPVTMNQPVTCTMPPAYLYYLSGRATG